MSFIQEISEIKRKLSEVPGEGLAKRVSQFLMLRAEIDKLDDAYTEEKKPLTELKAVLEGCFEKFLSETGQQNAVFPTGTIHWNQRTTASLEDPQAFMDFVTNSKAFDLIERKANPSAVRDFAQTHSGQLPPGVRLNTIRTVGARSPGAKVKANERRTETSLS